MQQPIEIKDSDESEDGDDDDDDHKHENEAGDPIICHSTLQSSTQPAICDIIFIEEDEREDSKQNENEGDKERLRSLNQYLVELNLFDFDTKKAKLKRFLNRMMGLRLEDQAFLFNAFIDHYDSLVITAQREGSYDDGICDFRGKLLSKSVIFQHPTNPSQLTHRYDILIQRGISWDQSTSLLAESNLHFQSVIPSSASSSATSKKLPMNGYYQHKRSFHVILALQRSSHVLTYHIIKPHLGHQLNPIDHQSLMNSYKPIPFEEEAKELWINKYQSSPSTGGGGWKTKVEIFMPSNSRIRDLK